MQNAKNKKKNQLLKSSRSALISIFLLSEFIYVKYQTGIVYYIRRFTTLYPTNLFIDYFYSFQL